MKSLKYGTETFTTSDAVADAIMTYAATLRGTDHGLLVTIPTIEDNGALTGAVSLVLGPGIPLLSRPSVSEVPDPEAVDLLQQMAEATVKRTGTSTLVPGNTGPDTSLSQPADLSADLSAEPDVGRV